MSRKPVDRFAYRRFQTSFITSIISISLVLFMLGILCSIILYSGKISDYIKENIGFTIFLIDNATDKEITLLQKQLNNKKYVKETVYVSKEEAATSIKNELGEDFVKFLGYNPLNASIAIKIKADYADSENIKKIEEELNKKYLIKEVVYQKSLLELVNSNVHRISILIILFSSLLLFISVVLINNTIRLDVYSKRFIIKSMLLIGATQAFIRKPFIIKGILEGVYGGIVAGIMLASFLYFANKQFPELLTFTDFSFLFSIFAIIMLIGIIISGFSNYLAVRRFLNMKTDYLYL